MQQSINKKLNKPKAMMMEEMYIVFRSMTHNSHPFIIWQETTFHWYIKKKLFNVDDIIITEDDLRGINNMKKDVCNWLWNQVLRMIKILFRNGSEI